jgi:hypothetical protein
MQTDYFVKGCGATALAFVDVMLRESDATFIIVDKRAAPGGHWNDAYPFVRLHQPSATYGVASRPLGHMRKDVSGFNQGLYELASGIEVADYFHQVMRDTFLPSGRVQYFPMSEVLGEVNGQSSEFISLLSGERHQVEIRKKFVDATLIDTSIPLTHTRKFEVAPEVTCIPPNDLTRLSPHHTHFTALGGGKTAIDCILWLLANGAKPERITWVLPRDAWLYNRANFQPGEEFFERSYGAFAGQYEIAANAASIRDLCEKMEVNQYFLRLDRAVWPTMMHGATVTLAELEQLRNVGRFIRGQHVRRLEQGRMILDRAVVATQPDELFIDCTARALAKALNINFPTFFPGIIRLTSVRQYQPCFSAALIAHLEATMADEEEKNKLACVIPMTDTVEDWMATTITSISNEFAWIQNKELRGWITASRLDLLGKTVRNLQPDDTAKRALVAKLKQFALPAVLNMQRLLQARDNLREISDPMHSPSLQTA